MNLPYVEDHEDNLQLGKTYLVPCVAVVGHQFTVPVHFHYDIRFMSDLEISAVLKQSALDTGNAETEMLHCVFYAHFVKAGSYEARVCRRAMPTFRLPRASFNYSHIPKLWRDFEKRYKAQKVDLTTMKCPHRGCDPRCAPKNGGAAVCPAHGLKWDLKTGELIPIYS